MSFIRSHLIKPSFVIFRREWVNVLKGLNQELDEEYMPKFTYIVVQKRHLTRFYQPVIDTKESGEKWVLIYDFLQSVRMTIWMYRSVDISCKYRKLPRNIDTDIFKLPVRITNGSILKLIIVPSLKFYFCREFGENLCP